MVVKELESEKKHYYIVNSFSCVAVIGHFSEQAGFALKKKRRQ